MNKDNGYWCLYNCHTVLGLEFTFSATFYQDLLYLERRV